VSRLWIYQGRWKPPPVTVFGRVIYLKQTQTNLIRAVAFNDLNDLKIVFR